MKKTKLMALTVTGFLTCSFLTACATPNLLNNTLPTTNTPTNTVSAQTPATSPTATTGDIGSAKACEIAMQNAKADATQTTVTKQKADFEDGFAVYDIEFIFNGIEYKYEIGSADGSIREASQKPVEQGMTPTNGQITAEVAKNTALTQAGLTEAQVTFTKQKLDYDDGRAEYEIEFVANGVKYEYTIDATAGTIINAETEMY